MTTMTKKEARVKELRVEVAQRLAELRKLIRNKLDKGPYVTVTPLDGFSFKGVEIGNEFVGITELLIQYRANGYIEKF